MRISVLVGVDCCMIVSMIVCIVGCVFICVYVCIFAFVSICHPNARLFIYAYHAVYPYVFCLSAYMVA